MSAGYSDTGYPHQLALALTSAGFCEQSLLAFANSHYNRKAKALFEVFREGQKATDPLPRAMNATTLSLRSGVSTDVVQQVLKALVRAGFSEEEPESSVWPKLSDVVTYPWLIQTAFIQMAEELTGDYLRFEPCPDLKFSIRIPSDGSLFSGREYDVHYFYLIGHCTSEECLTFLRSQNLELLGADGRDYLYDLGGQHLPNGAMYFFSEDAPGGENVGESKETMRIVNVLNKVPDDAPGDLKSVKNLMKRSVTFLPNSLHDGGMHQVYLVAFKEI